jgi:predicted Zn-dependent protease
MSRVEKQRRRQHRKEQKFQQELRRWRRSWNGMMSCATDDELDDGDCARDVQLLSYDISYDAIPQPKCSLDGLLSTEERERLFAQTTDAPAAALRRLNELLARAPDSPILLNWLGRCHSCLGDEEQAERVARLNFQRNPDYLFASPSSPFGAGNSSRSR